MPDKDIIMAKTAIIQRCLKRIKDVTGLDPNSIDDIDKEDIFILNLQRGVQATIDLATHIVASQGLGLPETIKDNFKLLKNAGVITLDIETKMKAMTGFRNIAVHNYQQINRDILKSILQKNLRDLEEFYTAVLLHFNYAKEGK
ncbi:MAG TPA: DUF86 domain-containing protein [Bacteroidaceae bacterium]|nr:DUF86 domain-containing protein [Bacteroidaceae bacterium]